MDAASTLSHMCMSDELKQPICQAHVLSVLLPLIGLQDDQVCTDVTRVLAEVADLQANESAIVASGGLHAAFRFFNILYVRYVQRTMYYHTMIRNITNFFFTF